MRTRITLFTGITLSVAAAFFLHLITNYFRNKNGNSVCLPPMPEGSPELDTRSLIPNSSHSSPRQSPATPLFSSRSNTPPQPLIRSARSDVSSTGSGAEEAGFDVIPRAKL